MKQNEKSTLLLCLVIPVAVGAVAGALTSQSMRVFSGLNQPSFAPPGWLFPVVWTILYLLMGLASYLVLTSDASPKDIRRAMILYAAQLVVNFFWSLIFFNLGNYLFAFVWLLLLWVLVLLTTWQFSKCSKTAAYLMIPYILWITFAAFLNYMIYILN